MMESTKDAAKWLFAGTTVSISNIAAYKIAVAGNHPATPEQCLSTHGGSGYAAGSYWDGDIVVCGGCGYRIENPAPTGGKLVPRVGLWGKILFVFGIGVWKPTWNSVWRFYGGLAKP